MKEKPSEDQMATIYSAIRYGDGIKGACRILHITKNQVDYWLKVAEKAKRKRRWDAEISVEEEQCLKLDELMRSADFRRRRR